MGALTRDPLFNPIDSFIETISVFLLMMISKYDASVACEKNTCEGI